MVAVSHGHCDGAKLAVTVFRDGRVPGAGRGAARFDQESPLQRDFIAWQMKLYIQAMGPECSQVLPDLPGPVAICRRQGLPLGDNLSTLPACSPAIKRFETGMNCAVFPLIFLSAFRAHPGRFGRRRAGQDYY